MKASIMNAATGESRERWTRTQRKLYAFGHAAVVTTAKNTRRVEYGRGWGRHPNGQSTEGTFVKIE